MLELRKKGNKHWLLIDEEIGEFTPSKFTINRLNNVINVVYFNNLKSKEYNVSDCYIFDIDETIGFNTSSGVEFMDKLEDLNCPCFQKDVNNFYISGGTWGSITGDIEEQADLQNALDSKLDKVSTAGVERAYIVNADGSQGTKATSEFGGVTSVTGDSVDNTNPLNPIINAIPLSGTTEGNPVTGDIEINSAKLFTEKSGEAFELNFQEKFIGYKVFEGNYGLLFDPNGGGITTKVIDEVNNIGLLGDADFSETFPENKLIYAQRSYVDTKVPKVSTAGVERAYIINADGSQGTKATSEIGTTQNYFTFSTNTSLTDSHHNAVIWVTATINITIPSGLRSDFNCTFRTLTGAIATFLTSGTTINAESDGDVQSAKTMSFLAQYTTNNYIISGGGLS